MKKKMNMIQKSSLVGAVSLAAIALIVFITFMDGGKNGVEQLAENSMGTAVTLATPASANAGTSQGAPPVSLDPVVPGIDMTPVAKAIENVGKNNNERMEAILTAIYGKTDSTKINDAAKGFLKTGTQISSDKYQVTLMGNETGDQLLGEALLVATGVNEDRYTPVVEKFQKKFFDRMNGTTELSIDTKLRVDDHDVAIAKNEAGVKTYFDIALAGDKKYTAEERKVLAQWSYDSTDGRFISKAADTERADIQKRITGAYASASNAKSLNARLKSELRSRFPANFHLDASDRANPVIKADAVNVKAWN